MAAPGPHWPSWLPYEDEEDDEPGGELTDAELDARLDAIESRPVDWDAAASAALAPLPDFELTDRQCMDVAALLAPWAAEGASGDL